MTYLNTLLIECLMQAFSEYFEAKAERDEAKAKYTGGSWGWAGHYEEHNVDRKAAQIQEQLGKVISAAVRQELVKLGLACEEEDEDVEDR